LRRSITIFIALLIALLSLGAASAHNAAQSTDVNDVVKKATQFLSDHLPKPFPGLDTFTYSAQTFPDGGLGCPEKGKSYPQTATPGYRFLLTVQGVIYEVHTNLDGSRAVLCDQASVKQNPPLNTFRSAQFSIAYPQAWTVTTRDASETYFGLSAAPVCSQPGMTVTLLGVEPPGKTAEMLLNDYQKANADLTAIVARTDIGDLGRDAVYQGACTDGSLRRSLVATFIAFSTGYRIVAFAPKNAFDQWSDTFQHLVAAFNPATVGGSGAAILAPEHASPTLLVHIFGGNVFMANVADLPGAPLTTDAAAINSTRLYSQPRVSPDGRRIAFIDRIKHTLYVVTIGKNATAAQLPAQLTDVDYPPAWSPDSLEIAYVNAPFGSRAAPFVVQAVRADGAVTRKLGTLASTFASCVMSEHQNPEFLDPEPAARVLSAEVGAHLFYEDGGSLLEWPTANSVLASNCRGTGMERLDVGSGQSTPIAELADFRHARLSPSKTLLAGSVSGKLTLFDLTANKLATLPIDADQMGWSANSSTVLYSTRTAKTPLKSARPLGMNFEWADYALTLHQIGLDGSTDTLLYSGSGYAIGSIAVSPDGFGVAFTVVQSDSALIEGIANKARTSELARLMPIAQIYWLPFTVTTSVATKAAGTATVAAPAITAAPTLLIDSSQPVFGPSGSLAVIGVPVAPRAGATNIPGG